ncbi:MAG: hypothetical protein KY475_05895, partial [Planctomycetes bacterium]|nr:hypothetical protein [Planctomycetota bacterium]
MWKPFLDSPRRRRFPRRRRSFGRTRLPRIESLEARRLLVGDFQNPVLPEDVDDSGFISLSDLQQVVTHLRTFGIEHDLTQAIDPPLTTPPFVDVNGDDVAALNDLLLVVAPLRDGAGLLAPTIQAALANDDGTPGDGVSSDATIAGAVSENLTPETRLVGRLDGGSIFLIQLGGDGAFSFDPGLPNDGSADGPHTLELIAQTQGGAVATFDVPFTLETSLPEGTISLSEGEQFLVQAEELVELGQDEGRRTLRIDVDARFDSSDTSAVVEDTLLVFLESADFPGTLLDRGEDGTSLFALSGAQADFPLGPVRFDGSTLEIDVTDAFDDEGLLVFKLLNFDGDNGSRVNVRVLSNEIDLDATERLALGSPPTVVSGCTTRFAILWCVICGGRG